MKRSRFTEAEIIAILREQEAGVATTEVSRKHAVSSVSIRRAWRRILSGLAPTGLFGRPGAAGRLRDQCGRGPEPSRRRSVRG